jgi:hypothetical protein
MYQLQYGTDGSTIKLLKVTKVQQCAADVHLAFSPEATSIVLRHDSKRVYLVRFYVRTKNINSCYGLSSRIAHAFLLL